MNYHIDAQIINMKAIVRTFEQSCKMAAMKDDGKISPEEEKILKKSVLLHRSSSRNWTNSKMQCNTKGGRSQRSGGGGVCYNLPLCP